MTDPEYISDAWLDAQLRDVPVPDGLLDRLGRIAAPGDAELDAALRDVPLPEGLLARLRRTVEVRLRLMRLRHLATAASLLLAVAAWYYGFVLSMVSSSYVARVPRPARWAPDLAVEIVREGTEAAPEVSVLAGPPGREATDDADERQAALPPVDLANVGPPAPPRPGFLASTMVAFLGSASDLDTTLPRWPVSSPMGNDPTDLWPVPLPSPRGIDPPIRQGFDLLFYREHGVWPFARPDVDPVFCVSLVPLAVDTSSYDLARRYLLTGMLPPREPLRTEEFLAAVDYAFPQPRRGQQMALAVGGGPSGFRGGDFKLLQVGVQAEVVRDRDRPGTRLTLVLDVSSSMEWGGRLEMAVRALEQLRDRLGPKDRVSVVLFSARAQTLAEDLAREDIGQLVEVLRGMAPSGSTNVAEGLRTAYALARRWSGVDRSWGRVVLLTDGLAEMDPDTGKRIEALLAEAAAEGIRLDTVDLGQERPSDHPDPLMSRLAGAGGGKVHRATNADQVRWAILEAATGQPQLVAADARLRVVFNPATVLSYRLLGHESKAILGLKPPRLESDFRSGQSATALYELRLKPGGGNDIAVAEVTWSDPATGQARSLQRKYQRGEFAPTVVQSPLWLQAAMVAAQAAEVLRDSPFAKVVAGAGSPGAVVEASRQLDSRLQSWPSLQEMVGLMEKAATAKPYRSGGRR